MANAPPPLDIGTDGKWVVRDTGAPASIQVRLRATHLA